MNAPCRGLSQLFEATLKEIKEQKVLNPTGYATAINVCRTCPHRKQCAIDGVRWKDRHTVRAGKRLWINQERAELLAIAQGESP